jgi:hypothetical protein
MKVFCIGLLAFAMMMLEVHLFRTWFLPYTDYNGIEIVYFVSLICRVAIYFGIIVGYDYLWIKYLSHNTMAYRKGLIKLYKNQIPCESPYMTTVLSHAIFKLEVGDNPTSVEEYVVRSEKEWRK